MFEQWQVRKSFHNQSPTWCFYERWLCFWTYSGTVTSEERARDLCEHLGLKWPGKKVELVPAPVPSKQPADISEGSAIVTQIMIREGKHLERIRELEYQVKSQADEIVSLKERLDEARLRKKAEANSV